MIIKYFGSLLMFIGLISIKVNGQEDACSKYGNPTVIPDEGWCSYAESARKRGETAAYAECACQNSKKKSKSNNENNGYIERYNELNNKYQSLYKQVRSLSYEEFDKKLSLLNRIKPYASGLDALQKTNSYTSNLNSDIQEITRQKNEKKITIKGSKTYSSIAKKSKTNNETNNSKSKNNNEMSQAYQIYYLQQKQEQERRERIRKQNIQNTANAMSGLMDMDFGYGERIGFFSLTGGFNYLWGDVDEASFSMPINASLELNIPVSKSYEIELLGDYNYNLDFSSSDIEATNESYYFAGGINLGKSRKFSVLYVNHNIKYYLEIMDESHNESYIGVDEIISTNGVGISYNFNGKYMDELGRILVLYTKGKDDVSNINVRYDMSTGALIFTIEYNQFTNKFMDYSVGSIGMRFGFKLPF